MAHIDWMLACELAYFDRQARMCMVGVMTDLRLPSVPLQMRQMMLVARLADRAPGAAMDVGFAIATPDGRWIGPSGDDDIHIEVAFEYILITIRDLPFTTEGMYQFGLRVNPDQFVTVAMPVLVAASATAAECH